MRNFIVFLFLVTGISAHSQNLNLPAFTEGAPNNYFMAGTGDGSSLSTYNVFLKLHYGLAIGSPYVSNGSGNYIQKATISIDGRNGNVNTTGILTAAGALISGNVGLGTTNPEGYKLAVNGRIRAKEVKVETQNWPDYVFKPTFKLMPLSTIEEYINTNGHLPEIPSAEQVSKEGLNLGEMNRLLLKKVEELTLHLIEKDKNEKIQQNQIDELKKQMKTVLKTNKHKK
jgi:hypothetical protein